MSTKPFPQSFWVQEGLLYAGHYPGAVDPTERDVKLCGLLDCGIRQIVSLMEDKETDHYGRPFAPYRDRLRELAIERGASVDCLSLPIRDTSTPSRASMKAYLDHLDESVEQRIATYFHCWGGSGRTSTVVASYLIRHGDSPQEAIYKLGRFRAALPKRHYPFEGGQEAFVLSWKRGE